MPKVLSISQVEGKPGKVYYPLSLDDKPTPDPGPNELLIKISACALNHRDLFIRQHLYPSIGFSIPLLADGCGVVVGTGSSASKSWHGKRVVINPGTGWKDSPHGPEEKGGYKILGGTKVNPNGTAQEYMIVDEEEVELAPDHLSDVEAAAVPLTGLTAWRAVMTKCGSDNIAPGKNVLVTGIGGGVALMALEFARAAGANVYVTSSTDEKIQKAVELGAKGGVIYKEKTWEKTLLSKIGKGNYFDCIVDGAGADIVEKGAKLLKPGGVIAIYGMTTGPKAPFYMQAVLKNIEIKGSTMGSRQEFRDMIAFMRDTRAKPVVSRVQTGWDLEGIDGLFEDMKKGAQFGKLVIDFAGAGAADGGGIKGGKESASLESKL